MTNAHFELAAALLEHETLDEDDAYAGTGESLSNVGFDDVREAEEMSRLVREDRFEVEIASRVDDRQRGVELLAELGQGRPRFWRQEDPKAHSPAKYC